MKTFSSVFILLFLFTANINAQKAGVLQQLKEDHQKVHEHLFNELIPFWDKKWGR